MKPLIFIHPLSPALKKLLEVLQENAEADNFEIFEINAINEAHQLVPTIGQSLTIVSNPKKCAMFMQPIRKVIKQLNSKVILLSPKPIPPKTLAKFQKIGLTECIIEPVPPKTLHYKVNLLLRSIVDNELEQDEEKEIKDLSKDEKLVDSTSKTKDKQTSDDSEEATDDYGYKRKKSKKFDDIEIDYSDEKKKKSSYLEEEIETNWKGKTDIATGLEIEDDDEEKKSSYSEEEIESYYKNKKNKNQGNDIIDDIQSNKSNYQEDELLNNDIHKTNNTLEEDLDKNMSSKQSKHSELILEDDENKNSGEVEESIDGYMRGKLNKSQGIEEDDEDIYARKSIQHEELMEEENKDIQLEEEDIDELPERKKAKEYEDLEDDIDNKKEQEEDILEPKQKKKRNEEELEEELEDKDYKQEAELLEEGEDLDDERGKVDEIDKYYRGGAAKKELEVIDEDENKDLLLDEENEEIESKKKSHATEIELEEEDKDLKQERNEYEGQELEDKTNDEDENLDEEDIDYKQKKEQVYADLEDDNKAEEDEDDEGDDGDIRHKKSQLYEDLEGTDRPDIERDNQEEESDYRKLDSVNPLDFDEDKKNGVHQKADHISTHYSSKTSTRHDENDWNIGDREKKEQQFDEYSKKQDDLELSFGGKKDLGEQTINYEQIKKEFLDATVEQTGSKSKKIGKKFISSEKDGKEFTKKKYNLDGETEDAEYSSIENEEEEIENPIFSSDPRGLDVAVKVLNIYYKEKFENDDIFSLISDEINQRFQGETSFILYDKNTDKYNLLHSTTLYEAKKSEKKGIIDEFENNIIKNESSQWKEIAVPLWSDITFQEDEITFSYPFFEGISRMGLCQVTFKSGFDEVKAKELEVILETTRGIYLNSYHIHSPDAVYKKDEKTENKNNKKKKGGLFSFLKKKKAS